MERKNRYEDILRLPRPVSQRHAPMPIQDRAAQFAPFAALTGYDAVIAESGRLTENRIELSEDGKAMLDEKLYKIRQHLDSQPKVRLVCFQADEWKEGGAYRVITGQVKKIDDYQKTLILTDGSVIPLDAIFDMDQTEENRP